MADFQGFVGKIFHCGGFDSAQPPFYIITLVISAPLNYRVIFTTTPGA